MTTAMAAASMEAAKMARMSTTQKVYDKIILLRNGPMKDHIPPSIGSSKISDRTTYTELANEYARVNYYSGRAQYATFMTNQMIQAPKAIPGISATSNKYIGTTFGLDLLNGWDRQLYDSRDAIHDAWSDMYDSDGPIFAINGRHKLVGILAQTSMTTIYKNSEIKKKDAELEQLRADVRRLGGVVNEEDHNDTLKLARTIVDKHLRETSNESGQFSGHSTTMYSSTSLPPPPVFAPISLPPSPSTIAPPPPPPPTTTSYHQHNTQITKNVQPQLHRLSDDQTGIVVGIPNNNNNNNPTTTAANANNNDTQSDAGSDAGGGASVHASDLVFE